MFGQAVRQGDPISIQEFTDDLQHRLWGVWRDVEGVDLQGSSNKLATYHALIAVPFDTSPRASARLPRHSFLELSQRVLQNISCFRAHKLRVETALALGILRISTGNVAQPVQACLTENFHLECGTACTDMSD